MRIINYLLYSLLSWKSKNHLSSLCQSMLLHGKIFLYCIFIVIGLVTSNLENILVIMSPIKKISEEQQFWQGN